MLCVKVLPDTFARIRKLAFDENKSRGEIIDQKFLPRRNIKA